VLQKGLPAVTGFPQSMEAWGIASAQVQRFYLSDVKYGANGNCSLPRSIPTTART
jgi:hypothetical protein